MSRSRPFPAKRDTSHDRSDAELGRGDPDRLAALLAAGEAPFPEGLPAAEAAALAAAVRRLRRERLVRFVARLIARSIIRDLRAKAGP